MTYTSWIPPLTLGALYLFLASALVLTGARSPNTAGNLAPDFQSNYDRTEQVVIEAPLPYEGWKKAAPPDADFASRSDLVSQGGSLIAGLNCAACHGLRGEGGAFAPAIAGASMEKLTTWTANGGPRMPAYASLTDLELETLAAYLDHVAVAEQDSSSEVRSQ